MRPNFKFWTTEPAAQKRVAFIPGLRNLHWIALSIALFTAAHRTVAQSDSPAPKPYATLDRQSVTYLGPIRATERDLPDGVAVIGMILPLRGPQQTEGQAILAAARLALEEEQALGPLPDGRKLALVARDESGPWGQASTEILKLIEQDHALTLLTSANGNSAHLAEQIANKIGIPILTFSSDPTTTQTNVPWLFRLGPSDIDQAHVFCHRIYTQLRLQKVLLIVQMDHDGRIGGAEFEKAAKELKATPPTRLEIAASTPNLDSAVESLQTSAAEAIVMWTDAPLAESLSSLIHKARPSSTIFLCRKAAQMGSADTSEDSQIVPAKGNQSAGESFIVGSQQKEHETSENSFRQQYLARTGTTPGVTATAAYEAVLRIAIALRSAGANRVRLRDYFAGAGLFRDTSRIAPFDPAGNSLQEFEIVKLAPASISETNQ